MLNLRSLLLGLTALLVLGSLTGSSDAYQVERVSWSELVATSQRAVHGHVASSWGEWAPDGSGRVITRYEILIWDERQAAGPAGMNRVVVTLPGGQIGNRRTVIPGLKPFEVGDELVLLLSYTPWGWQPIGYELGILRLNDQPAHQWPQLESLLKGALGRARVHP